MKLLKKLRSRRNRKKNTPLKWLAFNMQVFNSPKVYRKEVGS